MARGFLAGMIWGGVVSVGGAAVLSLLSPPPPSPTVAAAAPASGGEVTAPATESGVGATGADADLVERAPAAPDADGSGSDTLAPLAGADTESVPAPRIGQAGELAAPDTGPAASAALPQGEAPVAVAPPGTAPAAPASETELSISTLPAQPRAPEPAESGSGFGQGAAGSATELAPGAEADAPPAPQVAALPQAGTDTTATTPAIGTPVAPLTERSDTGVRRLPAIGEDTPEATAEAVAPVVLDGPPLRSFAIPYEVEPDKPMMAIVLIDDADAFGAEALETFPYPLAFAIDPTLPDAAARMAARRAAGFEVVALVDLPVAATAQDAEVALMASFTTLPETVAMLEGTGTGIQGSRDLSNQVTAIVQSTGRGLITQDNGLNTVQKLAQREGVASAVVFRDFDGAGQTPTVMRRFLDQAAFRAGQDGAVVMLGRVRPDTISALLLWGLQDRADRVALAPISAVLEASLPQE